MPHPHNYEFKNLLLALNQRPIAYYPIYTQITGSLTAGVFLSQIMYWSSAMNGEKFHKPDEEFAAEMGITDKEFKLAKAKLKQLEFLKITLEGIPAKTHYYVDYELYAAILSDCTKGTNLVGQKGQTVWDKRDKHIYRDTTTTKREPIQNLESLVENWQPAEILVQQWKMKGLDQSDIDLALVEFRLSDYYGAKNKDTAFSNWLRNNYNKIQELHGRIRAVEKQEERLGDKRVAAYSDAVKKSEQPPKRQQNESSDIHLNPQDYGTEEDFYERVDSIIAQGGRAIYAQIELETAQKWQWNKAQASQLAFTKPKLGTIE